MIGPKHTRDSVRVLKPVGRAAEGGDVEAGGVTRSPAAFGHGALALLVADLYRVLGCEVALVCELDRDRGARILCSSTIDRRVAISVPTGGGKRLWGSRWQRRGCFVGRALVHGRPAFEPLDEYRDADLIAASRARAAYAVAVPVGVFGRAESRTLVAAFSSSPADLGQTFWIVDAYARMIALRLTRPRATG